MADEKPPTEGPMAGLPGSLDEEFSEETKRQLEAIASMTPGFLEGGEHPPAEPAEQSVTGGMLEQMAKAEADSGSAAGHAQMASMMNQQMRKRGFIVVDEASDKGSVRKGDSKSIEQFFVDPKVAALDLATTEGKEEYERVMKLMADPTSGVIPYGQEQGPEILPNPNVDLGYSVIVVVRYSKIDKVIVDKTPQHDIIKPEQIRERFQKVDADPEEGRISDEPEEKTASDQEAPGPAAVGEADQVNPPTTEGGEGDGDGEVREGSSP